MFRFVFFIVINSLILNYKNHILLAQLLPATFEATSILNYSEIKCNNSYLEDLILSSHNEKIRAKRIEQFFSKCEPDLIQKNHINSLIGMYYLSKVSYKYLENPWGHKEILELNNGTKIPAFLALKTGKRPLIIARCGALCDLSESVALKALLAHAFDESPFHVLLLGSISGIEYQKLNYGVEYGGLIEGDQLIRIGQYLRQSKYADQISSLHALGVSLGAQSIYFGNIYNQTNLYNGAPLFSSFMALCPVVDLRQSTESLFNKTIIGHFAKGAAFEAMTKVKDIDPTINEYLKLPQSDLNPATIVAHASINTLKRRGTHLLPPFHKLEMNTINEFWEKNNILNLQPSLFQAPLLTMAATNDPIVDTAFNSVLLEKPFNLSSIENVGFSHTTYGSHCAHEISYGWSTFSTVIRSFFLSHSPEMKENKHSENFSWPSELSLPEYAHFINYVWEANEQSQYLNLTFHFYRQPSPYFSSNNLNTTPPENSITERKTLKIPLSYFKNEILEIPKSKIEAEIISRWANSRVRITDFSGEELSQRPGKIEWSSYSSQ